MSATVDDKNLYEDEIMELIKSSRGFAEEMPSKPLWRASDPLPSADELVNVERTLDSLTSIEGFWETPRGPTEARVQAYEPDLTTAPGSAERKAEVEKWHNSVLHPHGEAMAAWKNNLYLNSPAWVGGRPWSQGKALRRHRELLKLYPDARLWFADGNRLSPGARALNFALPPGSYPEYAKSVENKRVFVYVIACIGAGLALSAFSQWATGSKRVPTDNPDWHAATEEVYKKYKPDPIAKHEIGQSI
jgi:hypothetical protein